MAALLARFKGPSAPPSTGQASSCANCRAPLAVGQTWCLECGTAAPGRLGRGPGLRSSLGVVGVTLLLVTGAVAAAYAALASQSKQAAQTASVTTPAPGAPDVAPAVVVPPAGSPVPATSSAVPGTATAVPTAPKIPAPTPTPAPAPAPATTVKTPAAATSPKTTATTPAKTKTKTTTSPSSSGSRTPSAKSANIVLDTDAASDYNPYSLPPASFGDPYKAIDGDPQTAWTYQLDPSTAGKTLVGLIINLKSAQTVRSITIATPSPGMTVEFYGATNTTDPPVSISDPNWHHLATKSSLPAQTTVKLKTGRKAVHFILVWITHAPPGNTTGSLGVSELSVSS